MWPLCQKLQDLIYPPVCLLCGGDAEREDICAACAGDLPWVGSACRLCALPLNGRTVCGRCRRDPPPWACAHSALVYDWPVDRLIRELKFGRKRVNGHLLGRLLGRSGAAALRAAGMTPPDCLVPVPLHPARERRRGFNQAQEIARGASRTSRVPVERGLCRRVRNTPAQTGLAARERRRNLRRAFEVAVGVAGRRIALVDDVITTGATAAALTRAVLSAGAKEVIVWACARALPHARKTSDASPAGS